MGKREEGLLGLKRRSEWEVRAKRGYGACDLALNFYLYYFIEL